MISERPVCFSFLGTHLNNLIVAFFVSASVYALAILLPFLKINQIIDDLRAYYGVFRSEAINFFKNMFAQCKPSGQSSEMLV